jgi:segregation and condensation protein A
MNFEKNPGEKRDRNNISNLEVGNITDDSHKDKINQEQFYDLLLKQELSWQSIIYDLIQTEQLDPWDIDLVILTQKYLEKLKELEEANFFVSSKVLLAASLLLRIKSEILLNTYLKSLDEILFGKKEEKQNIIERIEIDESELPELIPKTPLPRFRQVSIQELITALGKAINTENRRIKREINIKRAEKMSQVDIPKERINIKDRIRTIYAKIRTYFNKKPKQRLSFTELAGERREDKLACFLPVLHLDNQQKIWLEQEQHFDEIWILLYDAYKKREISLQDIREEVKEIEKELDDEQKKRLKEINKDFENPIADLFEMTEQD